MSIKRWVTPRCALPVNLSIRKSLRWPDASHFWTHRHEASGVLSACSLLLLLVPGQPAQEQEKLFIAEEQAGGGLQAAQIGQTGPSGESPQFFFFPFFLFWVARDDTHWLIFSLCIAAQREAALHAAQEHRGKANQLTPWSPVAFVIWVLIFWFFFFAALLPSAFSHLRSD